MPPQSNPQSPSPPHPPPTSATNVRPRTGTGTRAKAKVKDFLDRRISRSFLVSSSSSTQDPQDPQDPEPESKPKANSNSSAKTGTDTNGHYYNLDKPLPPRPIRRPNWFKRHFSFSFSISPWSSSPFFNNENENQYHSETMIPGNPNSALDIPPILERGMVMTKISENGKQKRVEFRLDADAGQLIYKSSSKGIVPIECIKEIRTGQTALSQLPFTLPTPSHSLSSSPSSTPPDNPQNLITLIYILDSTYRTLHFIPPSTLANSTESPHALWLSALQKLYTIRQGLMTGLGNTDVRVGVWERQYWKGADEEGDGNLRVEEVEKLCWRLNVNVTSEGLRRLFAESDTNAKGHLTFSDFQAFVKRLKRRPELESIYGSVCSQNGGSFDLVAFKKFMRDVQKSKLDDAELEKLFIQYGPSGSSDTTTVEATPANATSPTSPPSATAAAPTPTAPTNTLWTISHFTSFLSSSSNSAFTERHLPVHHDMSLPISDYYISSSHNTYLVGNQLMGVSTIEGYVRALLHSCRSVELDIYDGDTPHSEPVIYHGKTLTSKITLRAICTAIAKYAFITSPYPLLISAEVHCSLEGQDRIVDVLLDCFGERLVKAPLEGVGGKIEKLPSPEDLKFKYLLKAKNIYVVAQLASQLAARQALEKQQLEAETESSTSSEDGETEAKIKQGLKSRWNKLRGKDKDASAPTKHKTKMSFRLASLLVYTVGIKFHGFSSSSPSSSSPPLALPSTSPPTSSSSPPGSPSRAPTPSPPTTATNEPMYKPEHIFSLSENALSRILKSGLTTDLVRHTHTNLVRVYPKGTRVNSSNFEPHRFWAAGCQVVAINWQTFDFGYMLNQAMFQRNGKAGYVLKPAALRNPGKDLLSKRTKHFLDVTVVSAQQLPRLRDSKGREIIEKSIVDPFVEVSLHIPDWSHSPFLPEASSSGSASGYHYTAPSSHPPSASPSASSARSVSFRTKVIKNNGFNPIWDESLSLPFDCVGDMKDLIFVRFAVRQQGKDGEGDVPVGVYCVPLGCLEQGYRHLPLHDSQLTQYLFATLFVNIGIRDIQ